MRSLLVILALLSPGLAAAAPVSIDVRSTDGKPVAGAVVQLMGTKHAAASTVLVGPFVMAQKDISFQPHVLIVPAGGSVSFPNRDKVRHHVYSFSSAKRFELKLYGQQETRSVTFDKAGVVALGCNIHDSMAGFIVVVDTPFAALTDARGRASFADVPAGTLTIQVWHPSVRAAGNTIAQPAIVASEGLSTAVTLRR